MVPRLDIWLVEDGRFSSRQAAKRAIKEGHVTVDGRVAKPSKYVDGTEDIVVSEDAIDLPHGYRKLERIELILGRDLISQGGIALDIGSSAGGFLSYLATRQVMVTGIEVSDEFRPHLTEIVRRYENVSVLIADAFEIDPEIVCAKGALDLLLIDVTTDPDGTLKLVERYTPLLKDSGILVCAMKSRLNEEMRTQVTTELGTDFDILHTVEMDDSLQEFHVIASRRYVFN
ncbi:MAG: S4 domain-containing protein [Candidatus Thorarchaeota archaeon]